MSQERVSNLALVSIEKELLKDLDYEDLVTDFAKMKARRICLLK